MKYARRALHVSMIHIQHILMIPVQHISMIPVQHVSMIPVQHIAMIRITYISMTPASPTVHFASMIRVQPLPYTRVH